MGEGDYPPLHSAKVKNARDNTFTSLYVHMVTKLCRDNLTLHVFHSKSSCPTHPLLSPANATRPMSFFLIQWLWNIRWNVEV